MATCRDVIIKGYRKLGLRGRGEAVDGEEVADGMDALQSLYDELVFSGSFGRVLAVQSAEDLTAEENTRTFTTTEADIIVTAPDEIYDAAGILNVDANSNRPPRDLSIVSVADGDTFLYSHARGAWDRISNLVVSDFAPLSERSLDGLACLLAVLMAEESQTQVGQITGARATAFRGWLSHHWAAESAPVAAEYF